MDINEGRCPSVWENQYGDRLRCMYNEKGRHPMEGLHAHGIQTWRTYGNAKGK